MIYYDLGQGSGSQPGLHSQITDRDIIDVAHLLNSSTLEILYIFLDLSAEDIEKAKQEAGNSINLQAKNVMQFWRQTKGRSATREAMLTALDKSKNRNAMEKLEQRWDV